MSIVIINPNSTERMTQEAANVVQQTLASLSLTHINVEARTNVGAPPAIQGEEDGRAAVTLMLKIVEEYLLAPSNEEEKDGAADDKKKKKPSSVLAFILACADDIGLYDVHQIIEARRSSNRTTTKKPVVLGITQAACISALAILPPQGKFSIVTTVEPAVPILAANVKSYGMGTRCASVRAAGVPVLDLGTKPDEALEKLSETIAVQLEKDGASAIVLGCAGMSVLRGKLMQRFPGVTFIDGVSAATRLAVSLAGLSD